MVLRVSYYMSADDWAPGLNYWKPDKNTDQIKGI